MGRIDWGILSYEDLPLSFKEKLSRPKKEPAVEVAYQDNSSYILLTLGEKRTGGYDIAVERIEHTGGKIVVTYKEITPQAESINIQVLTYPWKAIKVKHLSPVEVIKTSYLE